MRIVLHMYVQFMIGSRKGTITDSSEMLISLDIWE